MTRAGRTSALRIQRAFLAIAALAISSLIFLMLGMGECLPRDGSVAMQACDAGKSFAFWGFPVLVLATLGGSLVLAAKRPRLGLVALAGVPFAALAVLIVIEQVLF